MAQIIPLTPEDEIIEAKIREDSLDLRTDERLVAMAESHAAKIPHVDEDLDKVLNYPDAVRWELKEAGYPAGEIEDELASQVSYYQRKKAKLEETVPLIASVQTFRKNGKVTREPIG